MNSACNALRRSVSWASSTSMRPEIFFTWSSRRSLAFAHQAAGVGVARHQLRQVVERAVGRAVAGAGKQLLHRARGRRSTASSNTLASTVIEPAAVEADADGRQARQRAVAVLAQDGGAEVAVQAAHHGFARHAGLAFGGGGALVVHPADEIVVGLDEPVHLLAQPVGVAADGDPDGLVLRPRR